jgi:hypothetical protein
LHSLFFLCTHTALSLLSRFSLLSSVLNFYMRKESINIVAEKERVVDGGESG